MGHGQPRLHYAVSIDNPVMVATCLREGDDKDKQYGDGKRTPLFVAVERKNLTICKMLVEAGASQVLTNTEGMTPLHAAVLVCASEIVELLAKSDTDALFKVDSYGSLPWTMAHRLYRLCKGYGRSASEKVGILGTIETLLDTCMTEAHDNAVQDMRDSYPNTTLPETVQQMLTAETAWQASMRATRRGSV